MFTMIHPYTLARIAISLNNIKMIRTTEESCTKSGVRFGLAIEYFGEEPITKIGTLTKEQAENFFEKIMEEIEKRG